MNQSGPGTVPRTGDSLSGSSSKSERSSLVRAATVLLLAAIVTAGCGSGGSELVDVRIGIVSLTDGHHELIEGFIAGLDASGFAEGENVTFVYDGPTGSAEGIDGAVASVLESDVDLILSLTTPVTRVVKEATSGSGIPVVFAPVTDPVGSGIVGSLLKPGGNLTGVMTPFQPGKQMEYLLAVQPDTRRVLVPHNPNDLASVASLETLQAVADTFGVDLAVAETRTAENVSTLMMNLPPDVDAVMMLNTGLLTETIEMMVGGALKHRVPLITGAPVAREGALLSFGLDYHHAGEQAARMAASILRGTPPGAMPVEPVDNYLKVNLDTSEQIDLVVTIEVLQQAHEIFR